MHGKDSFAKAFKNLIRYTDLKIIWAIKIII